MIILSDDDLACVFVCLFVCCLYEASRTGWDWWLGDASYSRGFLFLTSHYLIDRAPDELWMEIRDIVQETGIKIIPQKKKAKKEKWLSGEALQIAVKTREVKKQRRKRKI